MFKDRTEAGRQLARRLAQFKSQDPVVLALPRGGVPVADEIARALGAPLDLILVRKIGAPWQPELALAAVADGEQPELVVNADVQHQLGVTGDFLEQEKARQLAEIERRRKLWLRGRGRVALAGRTVLIVDDGIATGATVRVALRAVRRAGARRVVLAVPVAPPETIAALRSEADEIVCLETPAVFWAISTFYEHFPQVEDGEVTAILDRHVSGTPNADKTLAESRP